MSAAPYISNQFLEAAASVAVLYVVVAWVSSKTVELWQLVFNSHGKMLRGELSRCFGDEKEKRLSHYFYWHPIISPLTQPSRMVDLWRMARRRMAYWRLAWPRRDGGSDYPPGRLPGYIAPETFAAVVMNPFPWPTTREPLLRLLNANLLKPEPVPSATLHKLVEKLLKHFDRAAPATRTGDLDWRSLLDRVEPDKLSFREEFLDGRVDINAPDDSRDPARKIAEMCQSNALITPTFETRINAMLREAEWDIDEFRAGLRSWFAEMMSRVSGRFRRTALIGVFLVAFAICLAFRINAMELFKALITDPSQVPRPTAPGGFQPQILISLNGVWDLLGAGVSAALAALGAPFWYDLLGKVSRRPGPSRGGEGS